MEQPVGSKAFLSGSLVRALVLKSTPKALNYPPPSLPLPHSVGTCLTVSPHTFASSITAASSIIPCTAVAIPSNYRTLRLRSPLETPTVRRAAVPDMQHHVPSGNRSLPPTTHFTVKLLT